MSTITSASLLDELQARGFTPAEDGLRFNLHIGKPDVLSVPRASVRVTLDDNVTYVYVMTGNTVMLWDVRLSHTTPLNVVTAVIDLAIARAFTGP